MKVKVEGEIEGEREVKGEARGEKEGIWRSNPPMEIYNGNVDYNEKSFMLSKPRQFQQ